MYRLTSFILDEYKPKFNSGYVTSVAKHLVKIPSFNKITAWSPGEARTYIHTVGWDYVPAAFIPVKSAHVRSREEARRAYVTTEMVLARALSSFCSSTSASPYFTRVISFAVCDFRFLPQCRRGLRLFWNVNPALISSLLPKFRNSL